MSNVDLYCKMLKKRNGMGKGMLIGEDALSLSDDNNYDDDDNNNTNVTLTEIARGTEGDDDKLQRRRMNGNW